MPANEANKAALLESREEHSLVTQGKEILEEQRDLLAHKIIELIQIAERTQAEYADAFDAARRAVRQALVRHGTHGLASFTANETALPETGWRLRNVFGTQLAALETEPTRVPPRELGDGWEASLELERALLTFHRLMELSVHMAALGNNLDRLTAAFARTDRRVNALENIIIPELRASIDEVEQYLEEMDRENLVRAHLAKRH